MNVLVLGDNQLTGTSYFVLILPGLVYESTVVLCAKKCVGVNPRSVHVRAL